MSVVPLRPQSAQAASASPGQARGRCLELPAIVYAGCGAVLSDLFIGPSEEKRSWTASEVLRNCLCGWPEAGKRCGTLQNSVAKPFGMTDFRRESALGRRRERLFQCGALSRPSPRAVKRAVHLCTHLRSSPARFPSSLPVCLSFCLSFCLPVCLSFCLPVCLSVYLSLLPFILPSRLPFSLPFPPAFLPVCLPICLSLLPLVALSLLRNWVLYWGLPLILDETFE